MMVLKYAPNKNATTVVRENIPFELQGLKQWCLWGEKKLPFQPNGQLAESDNEETWSTLDEVLAALHQNGKFLGIGFMFKPPYCGFDFDDVYDPVNDEIDADALLILSALNSYTEVSPSGTGFHTIVKLEKPLPKERKIKNGKFECYEEKRFFTFSTNVYANKREIEWRTNEAEKVVKQFFAKKEQPQFEVIHTVNPGERLTKEQIYQVMSRSKDWIMLEKFFKGDWRSLGKYPSPSEADAAFLNKLAFYTQKDAAMMEEIFCESGMYRPEKWHRKQSGTYFGALEIKEAIAKCTNVYTPKRKNEMSDFNVIVKDSSELDLKQILNDRRLKEMELIHVAWEENGGKGAKPKAITPIRCAIILKEYISFILFDLEENTRLAMYQPNEGTYTTNTTIIKRVISWLEPSLNENKANEVIYHLTNQADVKERTTSRYLIPVKNGVFNLSTKKLEPFSPNYVFTTKIATPYIENASNSMIGGWGVDSWIKSIACDDEEIITLLWQVINDSLNGNYTRKQAIFLLGNGNNGKGTFQELITNLIGPQNIATLKVNEFDQEFKLSLLEGKTAVIGDDVPSNVYIDDSSVFNSVVTGDRVTVNQKNKPMYSTVFRCSVIQSTNGMPKFKNKTEGTLRRIVIVPFQADFNGSVENFKIKEEYIKNPAVLQYVLYKAINMDFERFIIPKASQIELEEFKVDNDPIVDFKINVFDTWGMNEVPKYVVYGMYKHFCNENGYKFISDRKFHKQFKSLLQKEWQDGLKRFDWTELDKLGDLDRLGVGFPDKSKPQSTYKYEHLKIV